MKNWLLGLMVTATVGIVTNGATAQVSGIYVEYYTPTQNDQYSAVPDFPNRHASEPGLSSGSDIAITGAANTRRYRVFAVSPSVTDIGEVSISGTGDIQVISTTGIDADINGMISTADGEITSITTTGAGSDFLGRVDANPEAGGEVSGDIDKVLGLRRSAPR